MKVDEQNTPNFFQVDMDHCPQAMRNQRCLKTVTMWGKGGSREKDTVICFAEDDEGLA